MYLDKARQVSRQNLSFAEKSHASSCGDAPKCNNRPQAPVTKKVKGITITLIKTGVPEREMTYLEKDKGKRKPGLIKNRPLETFF